MPAASRWSSATMCSRTTANSTITRCCAASCRARGARAVTPKCCSICSPGAASPAWTGWPACSRSPAGTAPARRLLLARDRLGIKPLYYRLLPDGHRIRLRAQGVAAARQAKRSTAAQCATSCFTATFPRRRASTRASAKLPAGHTLTWERGSCADRALLAPRAGHRRAQRGARRWGSSTTCCAKWCPPTPLSDVPVGVFLSGGIDSALTAYYLDRPRTYTPGIREARAAPNSSRRARSRRHLGTAHTEMTAQAADFGAALERMPALFDEPFGDSAAWSNYLVGAVRAPRGHGGPERRGRR